MRAPSSIRPEGGFTTVEMMVVVLIVAILSMLAVPSMRDMIRNQRIKTASFDVFAGLVLARSEALKRNSSVTLAPNGGDWTNGWVATDALTNVVARQDPFAAGSVAVAGPGSITFNASGRLAAGGDLTISAPDLPTTSYRCIKIDLSGRPFSKQGVC